MNNLFNAQNIQSGGLTTGTMDASQAEELAKTMQIGHGYLGSPQGLVGGGALTMESIEGTLKSVTFDATNLVCWPSMPQSKAFNLVEQYIRQNAYGDGGSAYVSEAGSPAMNDANIDRNMQKVVFFATRRGVSLPSTLVRMNQAAQDPESFESSSGTLWILEKLERELYKGLADFSNNGFFDGNVAALPSKISNLNLAGIEQQLRSGDQDYTAQSQEFQGYGGSQSVISDRQGQTLDEGSIEDLANIITENFGRVSEMHVAPKNLSDFIKQFYPKERVNTLGVLDGRAGYVVKTMATTAGDVGLKPNVFLKPKDISKSIDDRAGVPAAPASASGSVVANDGQASNLQAGDSYAYIITSVNEQGECAAYASVSAQSIDTTGQIVKLSISSPSSGPIPTHYAVYRTNNSGSGQPMFIGFCARTGASSTFVDRGMKLPGAASAYMLDMRPEMMVWKQLAPMMKINLAQVTLSKEFILFLSGVLLVYAPRKMGMFANIGKASY